MFFEELYNLMVFLEAFFEHLRVVQLYHWDIEHGYLLKEHGYLIRGGMENEHSLRMKEVYLYIS